MDTDTEPQKRKRCDSNSTAIDGIGESIAKKRPSTAMPATDSPASPIRPTRGIKADVDVDSPPSHIQDASVIIIESPASANDVKIHTESPASPIQDSPDSPPAAELTTFAPADMDCSTSSDEGELDSPDATDDCLIVDQTIPLVVLDSDIVDAADQPIVPNSEDDDDCQILDKTVPLVVLDSDLDDVPVAADVDDVPAKAVEPLMRIRFRDTATGTRLLSAVQQAIRSALFRQQIMVDMTMVASDHDDAELELIVTECDKRKSQTASLAGQASPSTCVFMVDSAPSEDHRSQKASADVPFYSVNVAAVYDPTTMHGPKEDDADEASRRGPARPKNVCFNCEGDHAMRDCTQPRNAQKIRENRQNFGGGAGRQERYHVDANQKFANLEAGRVSEELRMALGLRPGDLPMHVYRMRALGYPPGWLEAAKVSGSGLALFDDKGVEMAGGGREEGATNQGDAIEYDLKQIISYPGYNVEPDKGTYDISYNLRLPPMQEHQSRAVMLQHLRARSTKSYKRQKHIKNIPIADADVDTSQIDLSNPTMDLDGVDADEVIVENPPVPGGEPPVMPSQPPPPPPPSAADDTSVASARTASPTMDDLRLQQEKLLAALDESVQSVDTSAAIQVANNDDSLIDDIMALDASSRSNGDDDSLSTTQSPAADSQDSFVSPTPPKSSTPSTPLNSSKHSMSGTPLLQSASPYTQLPAGSSWSVGVSDVIDFENLADSTGKFERMKGLIQKVRVAVKQLSDEYDG